MNNTKTKWLLCSLLLTLGVSAGAQAEATRIFTQPSWAPEAYIGFCDQKDPITKKVGKSVCVVWATPDCKRSSLDFLPAPTGFLEEQLTVEGNEKDNAITFMSSNIIVCQLGLTPFKMRKDGSVVLTAGDGNDRVDVLNNTKEAYRVSANLGAGDDNLWLHGTYTGLSVVGGAGADYLGIQSFTKVQVSKISMGSGADYLDLREDGIFELKNVAMGSGADEIQLGFTAEGSVEFLDTPVDCGTGNDSVFAWLHGTGGSSSTVNCEVVEDYLF